MGPGSGAAADAGGDDALALLDDAMRRASLDSELRSAAERVPGSPAFLTAFRRELVDEHGLHLRVLVASAWTKATMTSDDVKTKEKEKKKKEEKE